MRIDVAGPEQPPPTELLSSLLAASFGHPVSVDVRWTQRSTVPAQATPSTTIATAASDTTRVQDELDKAVRSWLATAQPASDFEVVDIGLKGSELTVDIVGSQSPPVIDPLTAAASAIAGRPTTVTVRWTQRHVVESQTATDAVGRARAVAASWAELQSLTEIASVQLTDKVLTVVVMAPRPPDSDALVSQLQAVLDHPVEIEVLFVQRVRLFPAAAPSTTLPSTSGPTTTSVAPSSVTVPVATGDAPSTSPQP